jgi:DNA-binding NtrC family response regulator
MEFQVLTSRSLSARDASSVGTRTDVPPVAGLTPIAQQVRAISIVRWGAAQAVEIVGGSPAIVALLSRLEKVARYREPVLITGESGVGKESLAQAVYLLGQPNGGPYVSVNCPQYQDGNLTVSELFGHTKGSFTGAVADRRGAFEEAHGGVIFLDEVGDLHSTAQAMLLRALATGEFRPLGATRPRSADVRVVSATNRPLNTLMITQEFRCDLFFRLRHFHLHVPPLRERGDDWRLIIAACLARLARKYGVEKRCSTRALAMLGAYRWPGNVRQLVSVISTGYALADADVIEPEHFENLIDATADAGDTSHTAQAREAAAAPVTSPNASMLLEQVRARQLTFWEGIYQPFLNRDLNREQVRTVIADGLRESGGSYRRLLELFGLPLGDYQKMMAFLRHHNLKP